MRQYLVTIGLFGAALVFYALSLSVPAVALAAIAVLFETIFWCRVLLRPRATNDLP